MTFAQYIDGLVDLILALGVIWLGVSITTTVRNWAVKKWPGNERAHIFSIIGVVVVFTGVVALVPATMY